MMSPRERLLNAWSFKESDCVPFELYLYPPAKDLPGADLLLEFIDTEASNFIHVPCIDWGFAGLDAVYSEDIIEEIPGKFKRILRTYSTSVGKFTAITKHNDDERDPGDFQWEKRYIETIDDFRRFVEADRSIRRFDVDVYNNECSKIGERGLPIVGLFHPLGTLVRNSNMEQVYMWLMSEEKLTMTYLENTCEQVSNTILSFAGLPLASPLTFKTYALEMLITPWMGKYHFDKFVFPFDKRINDSLHKNGWKHYAHCHGNSGSMLERFADMGIDGIEPLEPSPYADNVLADAKKRVGDRMVLCGNIPSQAFCLDSFSIEDVRPLVKQAIDDGKSGGGFILRVTSGAVGNGKTEEQAIKVIKCTQAMIDAWREFGSY